MAMRERDLNPTSSAEGGQIHILSAVYGINQNWFDVTNKVRDLADGKEKWERTVTNDDYGDPAPGYRLGNTLVVRYAFKGKVADAIVYQDRKISIPAPDIEKAEAYEPRKEISTDPSKIHIISAFYGINQSFFDVTDKLREKTQGKDSWAAVVSNNDWGDPAPGYQIGNTLIVTYMIHGDSRLRKEYEGNRIELK